MIDKTKKFDLKKSFPLILYHVFYLQSPDFLFVKEKATAKIVVTNCIWL